MEHQYQDGTLCLYFEGELDNLSVMKLKEPSIRLIERVSSPGAEAGLSRR